MTIVPIRSLFFLFPLLLINISLSFAQPAKISGSSPSATSPMVVINTAIRITSGDISALDQVMDVNIRYDYSEKTICDFASEEEFLRKETEDMGRKRSEKFIARWKALQKSELEPKFETYFNKTAEDAGIFGKNNTDSFDVTLVVKPIKEEPHQHSFTSRSLPYLHALCTFVDRQGKVLLSYELTAFSSRDNNAADRIIESYVIAGKMLGKSLVREFRKREKEELRAKKYYQTH
jgi:hypothetical protein